ncbi:MAG: UbiD family decarboxylase, partial [Chloroflexi bacterium]
MTLPTSPEPARRCNPPCRPAPTSSRGECGSRSHWSRSAASPTRSRSRGRAARRGRWPASRASSTSTSRGECRKFGSAAVSCKHSRSCRSTCSERRATQRYMKSIAVNDRPTDLREWLRRVDEIGQLQHVSGAHWNLEIGAISEINCRRQPPAALLFDDIVDYPRGYRVLTGSVSNASRMALTLGLSDELETAGLV